jgi:hypothetical protein
MVENRDVKMWLASLLLSLRVPLDQNRQHMTNQIPNSITETKPEVAFIYETKFDNAPTTYPHSGNRIQRTYYQRVCLLASLENFPTVRIGRRSVIKLGVLI